MTESRRLGRGLEALLGPAAKGPSADAGSPLELPVTSIKPNPFQPRREFEPVALKELADSIAASGLLQPIIVRPAGAGSYELIAGERRWRAVQTLGWTKVPAVVREADDTSLLTLALIENLQRDELSPLEEARGYEHLVNDFGVSQSEVARLVGKDRVTVANSLRLLRLPAEVQSMLDSGALSGGHGRALLGLADDRAVVRMAKDAVASGWSVRDLEARVRGTAPARRPRRKKEPERTAAAEVLRVEEALRRRLQTDVRVSARRLGRGFVTITYYSSDDLARLLELILGSPFDG